MSETLSLVRVGSGEDYPVEKLKEKLSGRFHDHQILISNTLDTPTMAFDSFRDQYHSTRILAILEAHAQTVGAQHMLGVASFDLYVPGMNFVFGEARCPGSVAVVSTYRLRTNRFDDPDLFESRVVKEAVHEVGHMLGLKHCSKASCVMYFSERLADTDRKLESYCSECEGKMKWLEVD
jgi:archaemetzincin